MDSGEDPKQYKKPYMVEHGMSKELQSKILADVLVDNGEDISTKWTRICLQKRLQLSLNGGCCNGSIRHVGDTRGGDRNFWLGASRRGHGSRALIHQVKSYGIKELGDGEDDHKGLEDFVPRPPSSNTDLLPRQTKRQHQQKPRNPRRGLSCCSRIGLP